MLPVGALCFYQAHFGRTVLPKWPFWAHLFYSVFYSVSELRRACFRQAHVARAVLPPSALFRAGAFAFLPCAPKSHLHQLPHLGPSDFEDFLLTLYSDSSFWACFGEGSGSQTYFFRQVYGHPDFSDFLFFGPQSKQVPRHCCEPSISGVVLCPETVLASNQRDAEQLGQAFRFLRSEPPNKA